MQENEIITLNVDVSKATVALEDVLEGFNAIKTLAKDIGVAISKAFVPVQNNLEKTCSSIHSMTDALEVATSAMQGFSEQLAAELNDDWFQEVFSAVTTGGSFLIDFIANVDKLGAAFLKVGFAIISVFSSGGMLGKSVTVIGTVFSGIGTWISGTLIPAITGALSGIGLAAGWVAAIIAAVIAAIVAVIVYWDEIKYFFTDTMPQLWAQFVEWVSGIAGKVAEVFSSAMSAIGTFFANCWNAIASVFSGIGQWIQENVIQPIVDYFTPAIEWLSELFNSIRQTVSDVFYNIGVIISGCWEILKAVWGVVAEWFDVNVIQPVVDFFVGMWTGISTWAVNTWNEIVATFTGIAIWFYQNVTQPVQDFFVGMWNSFSNAAVQAWEGIKAVFSKVTGFFKDVFTKAWSTVVNVFSTAGEIFTNIKDGILSAFKNIVNGIIKGLNCAIAVPFNGINTALGAIRDINILGLTPFSGLRTISVPQIPYLAQGAVLPANRPFLAVVGDQRHGTNVEAPLATIQEAVAVVIDDYVSAMMAGFEALLAEQKATRQAVESIHIGDDVLYKAVQRRSRVMAIARGGL